VKLICTHPVRYIAAVSRAFVYFLGIQHHRVDDENWSFGYFVFRTWPVGQDFEHLPGWIAQYNQQFAPQHYSGDAALSSFFRFLFNPYAAVVLLGSVVSLWWMLISLKQGDGIPFCLTGIPLSFLLLHALTMMSAARYAFPVYPIVLGNLVAFSALWLQGRARKRMLDSTRN
jgi:hypothetical protein